MSYQNFAVEVTALPNGRYRIAVQSPVGEASAEADSPFTPEEITSLLKILSREQRVSRAEETGVTRDFGGRLFTFLFRSSSEISNAYFSSLRETANDEGLRIRLSVESAGDLSGLPWELLCDPSNDFLALSRRTPITRYTQQLNTRPPAKIALPLRVLVMIAAPQDFPKLDVEGEWERLEAATASLRAQGLIELERLDTATLIALQRKLRGGVYHVFHFIGHSHFDTATQQGVLAFEDENDNSKGQIISAAALSRELAEESTVRLVVLNSCHSARRSPTDAFAGIASGLVTRGIPAVVAMQFAISDGAAKAFAEEFYRAISEMLPLDAAVSEARRAIANRVGNSEWATPVLYLRAADGVLFQPAKTTVVRQQRWLTPRSIAWGLVGLVAVWLLIFTAGRMFPPPAVTPTPTAPPADLPDLRIGNLRVSPRNPAPGQIFILSIPITNAGIAPSGPFNWAWDASTTNPVMQNSLFGEIDNIAPGASKNISFPFSYGWWGIYSSQLRIDWDDQVDESDELNNNKFLEVATSLLPFEIDFSRLPTNVLTEPPMPFTDGLFAGWNLDFAVAAGDQTACADTPLALVESDSGNDVLLTTSGDNAACRTLPLSVTTLRAPVSAATVEIVAQAAGTASFTYYADAEGTEPIFESQPVVVQAGQVVALSSSETGGQGIRRIDVSVPGQTVQITRVVLSAP